MRFLVQQITSEVTGLTTYTEIIRTDESGVLIAFYLAFQNDRRDARMIGLDRHRGQRLRFVGRDDQEINPLPNELLNLLDL